MAKTPRLYNIKADISSELLAGIVSGISGVANPTTSGVVSTTAQSFAGVKTFQDGIILPNAFTLRNKLINGDMRISQRFGASKRTNPTANAYDYGVDRWSVYGETASSISSQQILLTINDDPLKTDGLTYYLRANKEAAAASSGAFIVQQAIEGNNAADLKWGTDSAKNATLSFWARASASATYSVAICNATSNATMSYVVQLPVTTSWQKFTITIPGATSGTWASNNGCGISVRFVLGGGLTTSNLGQWKADNLYVGGNTQFGSLAQNSYFDVAGVQFETGSIATPFEHRLIGTELPNCQRYFEISPRYSMTTSSSAVAQASNGYPSWGMPASSFKSTKRSTPTMFISCGINNFGFSNTSPGTSILVSPSYGNFTVTANAEGYFFHFTQNDASISGAMYIYDFGSNADAEIY